MNRNFILLILAAFFLMIHTEIKAQISLFKKERISDKKIIIRDIILYILIRTKLQDCIKFRVYICNKFILLIL